MPPTSTQSLIGVKIIFMLIRNLRSLFDGLEPPTGRSDNASPDVIEEKESIVIIPEKFKDDILRLISYCGVELKSGLCIELELSELLEILPREYRKGILMILLCDNDLCQFSGRCRIPSQNRRKISDFVAFLELK